MRRWSQLINLRLYRRTRHLDLGAGVTCGSSILVARHNWGCPCVGDSASCRQLLALFQDCIHPDNLLRLVGDICSCCQLVGLQDCIQPDNLLRGVDSVRSGKVRVRPPEDPLTARPEKRSCTQTGNYNY